MRFAVPKNERHKASGYRGVYWIDGIDPATSKQEKVYYIVYRNREGKLIEEKAGRQNKDDMTPSRASKIRARRIHGDELSNEERREATRALSNRWTIGKISEEYFTNRDRRKSVQVDRYLYKRFLSDDFDKKIPEEVDPLSIDRFRKALSKRLTSKGVKKPLSPTSVRNALALLRQIVNHGMERRLTKGFPGRVPVPRVASGSKVEDLSPSQLSALLTAIDAEEDQGAADVVRLALYTGARREEILRLTWDDVDLPRGLWMLRNRKVGQDTGFPLSGPARKILAKRSSAREKKNDDEEKGPEYVFPGPGAKGYLRDPRAAFERIRTAAGLSKTFRLLHGCRHHFASMLVAEGVDLLTVARLLGHRDAQMVMRRYAHVRPGVLSAAAELSGKLIAATVAKARKEQPQQVKR